MPVHEITCAENRPKKRVERVLRHFGRAAQRSPQVAVTSADAAKNGDCRARAHTRAIIHDEGYTETNSDPSIGPAFAVLLGRRQGMSKKKGNSKVLRRKAAFFEGKSRGRSEGKSRPRRARVRNQRILA